jgi:hypothetical protein
MSAADQSCIAPPQLVFVDDATSRLMHLQFVESESTFAYFRLAGLTMRRPRREPGTAVRSQAELALQCPSSELLRQRAVEIKRGSGSSVW